MRRSILTSLVVIGAVVALVMGAGTFAVFTDSESITGNATSAIVDFELSGDVGDDTNVDPQDTGLNETANDEDLQIYFNSFGEACGTSLNAEGTPVPTTFDFFAPGDSCTIAVALTRDPATLDQQLAVDLSITAIDLFDQSGTVPQTGTATVSAACGGGVGTDWTLTATFRDGDGAAENQMPAAVEDTLQFIDVTLTLNLSADNDCQNDIIDGAANEILISILATQAADPHDETYD